MQLKTIEYVVTIAELGSFSRAAQRLYISQPTLSVAVKKLEEELGVCLFSRGTRSLCLSPAGQILVEYGRDILERRDEMVARISNIVNLVGGSVKLGISPFYSKYYLPKLMLAFRQRYPAVEVQIVEEISTNLEKALLKEELDLCMVPLYPENPKLDYQIIHQEEILIAIPPDDPINKLCTPSSGTPYMDLALLRDEPFVALKPVQKFTEMSRRLFEEAGFEPKVVFETLNWDTIHAMVENGMGVGLVPEVLVRRHAPHTPCYYRLNRTTATRPYTVATRRGAELSDAVRNLIGVIKDASLLPSQR